MTYFKVLIAQRRLNKLRKKEALFRKILRDRRTLLEKEILKGWNPIISRYLECIDFLLNN